MLGLIWKSHLVVAVFCVRAFFVCAPTECLSIMSTAHECVCGMRRRIAVASLVSQSHKSCTLGGSCMWMPASIPKTMWAMNAMRNARSPETRFPFYMHFNSTMDFKRGEYENWHLEPQILTFMRLAEWDNCSTSSVCCDTLETFCKDSSFTKYHTS